MTQESYGPIVAVRRVRDDAEALAVANALPFGLSAYVLFSRPRARMVFRRAAAERRRRDQRQRYDRAAGAVRRLEAVGARPRTRAGRPDGVSRAQAHKDASPQRIPLVCGLSRQFCQRFFPEVNAPSERGVPPPIASPGTVIAMTAMR